MRDQVTNKKFGRLKRNLARVFDRPEDHSAIVELVQFSRVIIQALFHNFLSPVVFSYVLTLKYLLLPEGKPEGKKDKWHFNLKSLYYYKN